MEKLLVKNLIKALQECDPNSEVVLQADPEGNYFREVWKIDTFTGEVLIVAGDERE